MWSKIKKAAKKVWNGVKAVIAAVVAPVVQIVNIGKELGSRLIGAFDFVGSLLGWLPKKRIRIHLAILSEGGTALASEEAARQALMGVEKIFRREANTILFFDGWPQIRTLTNSPAAALTVHCDFEGWTEDFTEAGAYFKTQALRANAGFISGTSLITIYGGPVTTFLVKEVVGKGGCSYWWVADYVTVDDLRARLIAHEIAHACGLLHRDAASNLLRPGGKGEKLTRWQMSVFRGSRHVTYL
jgi:hypothetical protein